MAARPRARPSCPPSLPRAARSGGGTGSSAAAAAVARSGARVAGGRAPLLAGDAVLREGRRRPRAGGAVLRAAGPGRSRLRGRERAASGAAWAPRLVGPGAPKFTCGGAAGRGDAASPATCAARAALPSARGGVGPARGGGPLGPRSGVRWKLGGKSRTLGARRREAGSLVAADAPAEPPSGAGKQVKWSPLESKFSELRFLCSFKTAAGDGIPVAFNCQVFSDGLWSGFPRLGPGSPPLVRLLRSPAALATQVTDSPAAAAPGPASLA